MWSVANRRIRSLGEVVAGAVVWGHCGYRATDWSTGMAYWLANGPRVILQSSTTDRDARRPAIDGAGDAGHDPADANSDPETDARAQADQYPDGVLPSHLIYTAAGWNGVYSDYADTDPDPQPSGDGEASITGLRADTAGGPARALFVEGQ